MHDEAKRPRKRPCIVVGTLGTIASGAPRSLHVTQLDNVSAYVTGTGTGTTAPYGTRDGTKDRALAQLQSSFLIWVPTLCQSSDGMDYANFAHHEHLTVASDTIT